MFSVKMIEAMIDFSFLLWLNIALIFVFLVAIKLWHVFGYQTQDILEQIVWSVIVFIAALIELIIFVYTVRSSPIFDFGFEISIFAPTIAFYSLLPFGVVSTLKTITNSIFTLNGHHHFKIVLFLISLYHIVVSLAYSSPSGLLISAVNLFVNLLILATSPKISLKIKSE